MQHHLLFLSLRCALANYSLDITRRNEMRRNKLWVKRCPTKYHGRYWEGNIGNCILGVRGGTRNGGVAIRQIRYPIPSHQFSKHSFGAYGHDPLERPKCRPCLNPQVEDVHFPCPSIACPVPWRRIIGVATIPSSDSGDPSGHPSRQNVRFRNC